MAVETQTGGRPATAAVIGGGLAIAVGKPTAPPPAGFKWRALADLARLESGHTPSRRHPEYWDGEVPWIGIKDATGNHGRTILRTVQTVTQAGIENSSARLLPASTVCLSRTASVGYVVVMGVPMATSQDFVNWVCGPELEPMYLKYVLQSDRDALLRFANGSTHQTIYFPEVKAFHALLPSIEVQRGIAATLGALDDKIESNRHGQSLIERLVQARFEALFSVDEDPTGEPISSLITVNPRRTLARGQLATYVGMSSLPEHAAEVMDWDVKPFGSGQKFMNGDVVMARITPCLENGKTAVVDMLGDDEVGWGSTEYIVLTPRGEVSTPWIYCLVRSESVRGYAIRSMTGTSGRQRFQADAFEKYKVSSPNREALQAFSAQAQPLFARMTALRDETRALTRLRDTLLPELLSGRICVPEAAKAVRG